ncbi:unnamed protein product [Caenorhabditis brenneri]
MFANLIFTFIGHYSQELTNLMMISFGLNSMATSLAILLAHSAYRTAVLEFFRSCGKPKITPAVSGLAPLQV